MITEYFRPETLAEALELLARKSPVTVPMGGGTVLSQRHGQDFAVIDLQKLSLNKIEIDGNLLKIGGTATLQHLYLCDLFSGEMQNTLQTSLEREASINIRRMATIAGTLVSCDGRSPLTTALLALDARLAWTPGSEIQGLGDFLPLREPFGHERLILEVRVPVNVKLKIEMVGRTPMDRPVVCAAVATWPSGRTRIALGGHGNAPILAMDGPEPGGAVVAAREAFRYSEDAWASAAYRSEIAGKLVQRMIGEQEISG
jgi:CO/xanthine dehydrogenase FAD-binding subunit